MTPDRNAVREEYAKLAAGYDSRWSRYVRATTDATVARLPQSPGDVLDVGCGTGSLLSRLTDAFPDSSFAGVDASAEMLDIARTRLPADIELEESWAERLPYDDCKFDTVVSCNMFHYIRHPEVALEEMIRVLRPNGTLLITDWCEDYITCKLCDWYLRWFDRSHFRMYGTAQFQELLSAANTRQIKVDKYKITWFWGLMTAIAHKPSRSNHDVAVSPLRHAT